jgi:hypothetical protein
MTALCMCGLLGYIFACPCGPRFKEMFTLRGRLRDRPVVIKGTVPQNTQTIKHRQIPRNIISVKYGVSKCAVGSVTLSCCFG